MHLAFDAKRAFHNRAGLGNYSRNLLRALMRYYPETRFSLYTPKPGNCFSALDGIFCNTYSASGLYGKAPALWRSFGLSRQVARQKPDLFHGLSHELPFGIRKSGVKSVVTIHDLIFERYPEWYSPVDRQLYRLKYRYACSEADRIIAIGQQTAEDLQNIWNVDGQKIDIVRQSCHTRFWETADEEQKKLLARQYHLPDEFMLQVGTIEPRKNLFTTLKALVTEKSGLPLVVVGKATSYMNRLLPFIERHNLTSRVIFIHDLPSEHLPALYQMAALSVYPSVFEGFGLPVLESIVSGTPVITSNRTCFTDAGGEGALYVSPYRPDELAGAIDRILSDSEQLADLRKKGAEHVRQLTPERFATNTMQVYLKVIDER